MDNERAEESTHVKPEFGSSGYFCIELFCGSGNLTFAMKHFFPDSFGVDHKEASWSATFKEFTLAKRATRCEWL